MTPVDILRQRIDAVLDRPMFHDGDIPAAAARDLIRAALDEPADVHIIDGPLPPVPKPEKP